VLLGHTLVTFVGVLDPVLECATLLWWKKLGYLIDARSAFAPQLLRCLSHSLCLATLMVHARLVPFLSQKILAAS
jgi:hypothetical protein